MGLGDRLKNCCQIHWQGIFYFFSPLIILPLVFLEPIVEWRAIFVILWTFIWYLIEPAPVGVIGMIPIVFLPPLGVIGSNEICMTFAMDASILFLLCNFIASAMQHCNITKRHAFFILSKISCDPQKVLVALMVFSYILTAFLPAAFVCALMMPTIRALVQYLDDISICKAIDPEIEMKFDEKPYPSKVSIAFYIGVAYAVNIGSITLALSSDSGLALRELITNVPDLSKLKDPFFLKYLLLSLPVSLLLLIFAIFYLEIIFLGLKRPQSKEAQHIIFDKEASKTALDGIAKNLPPYNAHMGWVATLFILSMIGVVVCSILRPEVNEKTLKYSLNAMMLCFVYFVLPRNFDFCSYFRCKAPKEFKTAPSILPWVPVKDLTPWSTFFVYGSGVSFGYLIKRINLHLFVGDFLLKIKNNLAQQIGFIVMTMAVTIIASNNHVADVMLSMALKAVGGASAEPFLYPITWATCITFLLPVSSAGNCFAMGWGFVRAKDMLLAGIGPTIFGFLITLIMGIILTAIN